MNRKCASHSPEISLGSQRIRREKNNPSFFPRDCPKSNKAKNKKERLFFSSDENNSLFFSADSAASLQTEAKRNPFFETEKKKKVFVQSERERETRWLGTQNLDAICEWTLKHITRNH